ncbi:MAG: glycosyltransferase family 4 protein [Candidatus Promineifilaceae bacterium]
MNRSLILATAGLMPDQLNDTENRRYPRVDYLELQRLLNADVLDYGVYEHTTIGKWLRRLETRVHSDLYLTLLGLLRRHRYGLVFTMSERAGIPYAGLQRLLPGRRQLVSMIHSWSWRQERAFTGLKWHTTADAIIVHCQSMRRHLIGLGADPAQVHVIPYSVDERFFRPEDSGQAQPGFILSVGEPRTRDYASLFKAVESLPLRLCVAASGIWYARESKTRLGAVVPANVTVSRHLPRPELRTLYARSQFVVLPLRNSIASYGATASLEAACMGRAVVANGGRGLRDYVIHGVTGLLVEPGDPGALQEAIAYLWAHPEEAQRMGQNGRQRIEEELNLDRYVGRLASLIEAHSAAPAREPARQAAVQGTQIHSD